MSLNTVCAAPQRRIWTRAALFGRLLPGVAGILALIATPAFAPAAATLPIVDSVGIEMVAIPAGSFQIGQASRGDWDERPVHQVTISQPFLMSVQEVTLDQYRKFRPTHQASVNGKATGVTWYEATAYCDWLSEKEGKPYRLPTEAEWEYACRAGTVTKFWSGDVPPLDAGTPNPWGLKCLYDDIMEWCADWHGPYPASSEVDPVGPNHGMVRVVRGGKPDNERTPDDAKETRPPYYHRSANRAGMPPAFGLSAAGEIVVSRLKPRADVGTQPGLIGTHFGERDFSRPLELQKLESGEQDWGDSRGKDWSARWVGSITAPVDGEITFTANANDGVRLKISDRLVLDSLKDKRKNSGVVTMRKNEPLPITLEFSCARGSAKLQLLWSWSNRAAAAVPREALSYTENDIPELSLYPEDDAPGRHAIGFRVVQAPLPATTSDAPVVPFVSQCVPHTGPAVTQSPDPAQPYFRKRYLLPIPPDNSPDRDIAAAGLHPSFRHHNHSPALEVCPNGDILMITYTSYREYEPGVSLMAARLRHGADQWEMPEPLFDLPDVNDHAPMLWTDWEDQGRMYFFWGSPGIQRGGFPFQWMTSSDSGATWSEVHIPRFTSPIGAHARQPINTALRGLDGTLYVASDAVGATSVLWATKDHGKTWFDTLGRSAGRHTTYCLLKDGRILGMGGKNSNIDGYMPMAISADGGKTWVKTKTGFAAQSNNQRPSLLRLQSGRLFFAGDFQSRSGEKPAGITQSGSYVALSDDEGETWHIKRIPGAQPHEDDKKADTLGYSAARQAPNGLIHLISSMNTPCLHFELNEAWILSDADAAATDADLMPPKVRRVAGVKTYEEKYPSGKTRATWTAGIGDDGRYLLEGAQTWYFENGRKQYAAEYQRGTKVGRETQWRADGQTVWQWEHRPDGASVWTQYWEEGQKKAQSTWRNHHADGRAQTWDRAGKLVSDVVFSNGKLMDAR